MAEDQHIGSILLADCGTVMTKAVLLEQVDGQFRFVAQGEAPTTAEYPWSDVAAGITHAVEQISEVTGRHFFDAGGNLISPELAGGEGVDVFAATISAAQPLQVVLAGLVRDLSAASAERAAAGTYSLVKAILASDGQAEGPSDEAQVRTICDAAPDVICIAGGTEGGAASPVLELVEMATLACSLMDPEMRPRLLYVGNSQLRRSVVNIVGEQAVLEVADNVRPTLERENLAGAQAELDALYMQDKMESLPGVDAIRSWSRAHITPTARAFSRLIEYLWHLGDPSKGEVTGYARGDRDSRSLVAIHNPQIKTKRVQLKIDEQLDLARTNKDFSANVIYPIRASIGKYEWASTLEFDIYGYEVVLLDIRREDRQALQFIKYTKPTLPSPKTGLTTTLYEPVSNPLKLKLKTEPVPLSV